MITFPKLFEDGAIYPLTNRNIVVPKLFAKWCVYKRWYTDELK